MAIVVQQLDSILLQPLIMGKTMKLHPVTIMIGILIFGYFFGVLGMILATPIIGSLKVLLNSLDERYEIRERINSAE
jgi:predicted PurR-regulated permease PerM